MPWYSSSCGKIEFQLTMEQAHIGYHQGQCDLDIEFLMTYPEIRAIMDKIDPVVARDVLREFGAWEDEELQNHQANLQRILWTACGDIVEHENELDGE